MKSHLVACGFEEDSSNFTKDPPIWSHECLHLVFATAATMSWDITAIDIATALINFLQGGPTFLL